MAKVTVAICTYNRAEMLKEAIQSVLNQSYRDMKIVVLDNCSTDNTKDVVLSFDDERLEYRCNETNLGLSGNWNRAIDICDTEYLSVFHDDDRMFPWMIEKLVEVMETYQDVDLAASSRGFELGCGPIPSKPDHIKGCLYRKNELIEASCKRKTPPAVIPPSVMLRSRSKKTNLRFRNVSDVGAGLDSYFWLEANSFGLSFYLLNYPLLETRRHDGSATKTLGVESFLLSYEETAKFVAGLNLGFDVDVFRKHFMDNPVVCAALGYYIMKLGKREISIKEFREKENELRSLGVHISFKRKVKWFLKYVLWKRWMGL